MQYFYIYAISAFVAIVFIGLFASIGAVMGDSVAEHPVVGAIIGAIIGLTISAFILTMPEAPLAVLWS